MMPKIMAVKILQQISHRIQERWWYTLLSDEYSKQGDNSPLAYGEWKRICKIMKILFVWDQLMNTV